MNAHTCVGGLYEVGIGVPDLASAIQYFESFGFRVGDIGELHAHDAMNLYGTDSRVRSVRLLHQNADHGLVRLMCWDTSRNDGLGMHGFRCAGNRWSAQMTTSVMNVANHALAAQRREWPVRLIEPIYDSIYQKEQSPMPFRDPVIGVREMCMIQPMTRQILFQRFGYENPEYGRINPNCLLETSQITHFGGVIASTDATLLEFYDGVLGLLRAADVFVSHAQSVGSVPIFEIPEGEPHWMVDFDDPANAGQPWQARRSGRLKLLRFESDLPDLHDRSSPGALGYSLYTWRVGDIEIMHRRVEAGGGTQITDVMHDEFGQPSFSFRAPDGYFWVLIQA